MRLRRTDPHTLAGAYALDALGAADRENFERHLLGCEACRAEAAGLRDAAGWLAEPARARQQPPPVRGTARVRRSWHGIGWRAPRLAVAMAGAGMLVALALGTLLLSTQHQLRMQEAHSSQIAAI